MAQPLRGQHFRHRGQPAGCGTGKNYQVPGPGGTGRRCRGQRRAHRLHGIADAPHHRTPAAVAGDLDVAAAAAVRRPSTGGAARQHHRRRDGGRLRTAVQRLRDRRRRRDAPRGVYPCAVYGILSDNRCVLAAVDEERAVAAIDTTPASTEAIISGSTNGCPRWLGRTKGDNRAATGAGRHRASAGWVGGRPYVATAQLDDRAIAS